MYDVPRASEETEGEPEAQTGTAISGVVWII